MGVRMCMGAWVWVRVCVSVCVCTCVCASLSERACMNFYYRVFVGVRGNCLDTSVTENNFLSLKDFFKGLN